MKSRLFGCMMLAFLLLAIAPNSTQLFAQDDTQAADTPTVVPTTEPVASDTPIQIIPTEVPSATFTPTTQPTAAPVTVEPTLVPETTVEVIPPTAVSEVTSEPTLPAEVTDEPTVEATATVPVEITDEPSVEVTDEATSEPTVVSLPADGWTLVFSDNFESNEMSQWQVGAGWGLLPTDTGQVLRVYSSDASAVYTGGSFYNVAAEVHLLTDYGTGRLTVRESAAGQYSAVLAPTGDVLLERSGNVVNKGKIEVQPDTWHILRIEAVENVVTLSVDGVMLMTYTDTVGLPPGNVSISATFASLEADTKPVPPANTVEFDDFAVWLGDGSVSTPEPTITPELAATVVPTLTATPEPEITAEPTLVAPVEITAEVTAEPLPTDAALAPEPELTLLSSNNFDDGSFTNWQPGTGWTIVPSGAGQALQVSNSPSPLRYAQDNLADVAVQMRLQSEGKTRVTLRQSESGNYTVYLDASGEVTLYRFDVLMASAPIAPSEHGAWRTLRVSAIGDVIRVAVDGEEVIAIQDSDPLPAGAVFISAPDMATLMVDDLEIWKSNTEVAELSEQSSPSRESDAVSPDSEMIDPLVNPVELYTTSTPRDHLFYVTTGIGGGKLYSVELEGNGPGMRSGTVPYHWTASMPELFVRSKAAVSPDGKWIAFGATISGAQGLEGGLYIINTNSGQIQKVLDRYVNHVNWAPGIGNLQLVFSGGTTSTIVPNEDTDIYVGQLSTSPLTFQVESTPRYSNAMYPDINNLGEIAYVKYEGNQCKLYFGTSFKRVLDDTPVYLFPFCEGIAPDWSVNGNEVVAPHIGYGLEKIPKSGSVAKLDSVFDGSFPDWRTSSVNNGPWIYYQAYPNNEAWTHDNFIRRVSSDGRFKGWFGIEGVQLKGSKPSIGSNVALPEPLAEYGVYVGFYPPTQAHSELEETVLDGVQRTARALNITYSQALLGTPPSPNDPNSDIFKQVMLGDSASTDKIAFIFYDPSIVTNLLTVPGAFEISRNYDVPCPYFVYDDAYHGTITVQGNPIFDAYIQSAAQVGNHKAIVLCDINKSLAYVQLPSTQTRVFKDQTVIHALGQVFIEQTGSTGVSDIPPFSFYSLVRRPGRISSNEVATEFSLYHRGDAVLMGLVDLRCKDPSCTSLQEIPPDFRRGTFGWASVNWDKGQDITPYVCSSQQDPFEIVDLSDGHAGYGSFDSDLIHETRAVAADMFLGWVYEVSDGDSYYDGLDNLGFKDIRWDVAGDRCNQTGEPATTELPGLVRFNWMQATMDCLVSYFDGSPWCS